MPQHAVNLEIAGKAICTKCNDISLMFVFCAVTPCGLIGRYKCVKNMYCFHLQP
jgi:hypothetical protein